MLYNSIELFIYLGWNWKSPPRWAFQIRSSRCFLIQWSAKSPRQPRCWCTPQIAAIEPEQAGELDGPVHAFFCQSVIILGQKGIFRLIFDIDARLKLPQSNLKKHYWSRCGKSGELDEPVCVSFRQTVLILGQNGIFRLIFDIDVRLKLPQWNLNKH